MRKRVECKPKPRKTSIKYSFSAEKKNPKNEQGQIT
jgi:hypothetical protein